MLDLVNAPTVETTAIPGLLVLTIPVHGDARGWFKENWQREKMTAAGLPDFGPVQNNVSFNGSRGATRGIHAEPWDKLVSVATGRVFGAWVDLREGDTFGTTVTVEIGPGTAVFVPRGVGNSYQALEDATAYTYLVNAHWRPGITYPALALDDPTAAIDWPIPLSEAEISDKDRANPRLADVTPFARRVPLVIGAKGQLGRALTARWPDAVGVDLDELDITDAAAVAAYDFSAHDVVVNAAAMTAVDAAETPEGRRAAWAANATAPMLLARAALAHGFTLVHYSSDYVFDGTSEVSSETDPITPLGVYGQSKAAGDLAVQVLPRHYVLRTSWVIGDGANFVDTMTSLAQRGICPSVVDDQVGRLTFTQDLAAATDHLLTTGAPFGTYNCTSSGESRSWAAIAADVFAARGRDRSDVTPVTTEQYYAGKRAEGAAISPRPARSTLSLDKLEAAGFTPRDGAQALAARLTGPSA